MLDISSALFFTAFFGGVLMFLAPCTLPLVPAFIASLIPGKQNELVFYKRIVLRKTIYFSVGFTLVFVCFGVLTGLFGATIATYKLILSQIGGVLIIIFGLALLNVFSIPFLGGNSRSTGNRATSKYGSYTPLILGVVFALGWTPCAGPILASILLLASDTGTALEGGVLLFIFSIGLAIPFILVGIFLGHASKLLAFYERFHKIIGAISGVFLITLGIFLVFGQSIIVTSWGFALYSFFGYTPMCTLI